MGTTSDKLNKILSTKNAIKNAIINKGVNIDSSLPFSQYASKISEIQGEISNIGFNSIENLDNGWKYKLINSVSNSSYSSTAEADKNFDDSSWENVLIPHDWSIYNNFNSSSLATYEGGYLDGGDSWYRKNLNLTDNSKRVFIYFDGVYKDCDIYINGSKVGSNKWYNPFYFDITNHLSFDGNDMLAVFVRNRQPSSRWYSGSGIIRNVYLLTGSKVALGINDVKINYNNLETELLTGIVNTSVTTKINNISNESQSATVKYKVSYHGEIINTLTESATLNTGVNTLTHTIEIPNPKLWDVYQGNLYNLNIDLIIDGTSVYTKDITYGYRYFKFDKDGFSLNGNKLKMKGVCLHHDLGCLGAETNYSALLRQIKTMKEMGCNAIRVTHNPASSELLEVCAKEGIMVVEELFDCWTVSKKSHDFAKDFNNYYQSVIETTVNRGYNNPSIIMWSLGNEIIRVSNYSEEQAIEIVTNLINGVKAIDTTRLVTMGDDTPNSNVSLAIMDLLDVIGVNYGSDSEYSTLRAAKPNKPIYGSETTSAFSSRGIYVYDAINMQCPSYDDKCAGWGDPAYSALKRHMDSDYLAGMFVWTGFDYIGEPTPFNAYPARSSYFGIVDLAGFPKDIYYMYQSRWTDKPMVHILPHWTQTNTSITVWLYSNCYKVELFLNGASLGSKLQKDIQNKLQFLYTVTYEAGTLVANGYDENGNVIAQDIVYTSYSPKKIVLNSDKASVNKNSDDLIFIECDICDTNETLCPTASNQVTFTCTNGTIVGTDNGDATDVTSSLRHNVRKAFNGKCLAVIRPNNTSNDIVVTATSDGLTSGNITIKQNNITSYISKPVAFIDATNPPIRPSEPINITGITLSQTELSIPLNSTSTLTASLIPSNTTQKRLTWSVSPTGIATVSDGVITPITQGSCTITCSSSENPSVSATCSLTVTEAITLISGITLDKTSLNLSMSDTATLNATITPSNASNQSVTWSASNSNVSLSPSGLSCTVTPVTNGSVTITVTANDGSSASSTCNILVYEEGQEGTIPVYSLENQEFAGSDGSQVIVTEHAPFASSTGFTVYADFTISPEFNNQDGKGPTQYTIFQFMKEASPWGGITVNKDTNHNQLRVVSGNIIEVFGIYAAGNRYRLAITYSGSGKTITYKFIENDGTEISSRTFVGLLPASPAESIITIGGYLDESNNPGRLFKGTINKFKYYESVLTDENINALFESPLPPTPPTVNYATGISFKKDAIQLKQTKQYQLEVTLSGGDVYDSITYSANNENVSVTSSGLVTGNTLGESIITVTMIANEITYEDTCTITVIENTTAQPVEGVLYNLDEPTTFDGTNFIDTGVCARDIDKDLTIFISYNGEIVAPKREQVSVMHCMLESNGYPGLSIDTTLENQYRIGTGRGNYWLIDDEGNQMKNTNCSNEQKVCIRITSGSNAIKINYKIEGKNASVKTIGGLMNTATFNNTILLGAYRDSSDVKGRYWKGTINSFTVYDKVLTDEEVNALFG